MMKKQKLNWDGKTMEELLAMKLQDRSFFRMMYVNAIRQEIQSEIEWYAYKIAQINESISNLQRVTI